MSLSTSTTLVNVADEAELRLINLLVEVAPTGAGTMQSFYEQCKRCISDSDAAGLVTTIIESDPSAIQSLLPIGLKDTEEAIAAFSLLTALLQRVNSSKASTKAVVGESGIQLEEKLATDLANAIVNASIATTTTAFGNTSIATDRKVALLSVLYNMRSNPLEKVTLLQQMIQLAGSSSLLHADTVLGKMLCCTDLDTNTTITSAETISGTVQSVPSIVTLLDTWNIPSVARRSLYSTIVNVLSSSPNNASNNIRKQQFLLLLIDTYTNDTTIDTIGMNAARDAAMGAIRDPVSLFHQQRNMLRKPAIFALQKSDAKLYGLLQVLQEGKLSDYESYITQLGGENNPSCQEWNITVAVCRRYMRILSLCSLASEHEEIPYNVIAETLQLPLPVSNEDIETWVIAAVNSGLLHAKMDQLQQKVMVERCIVRRFDMEKWRQLQARLQVWKQNVGAIVLALQSHATGGSSGVTAATTTLAGQ